jgi:UDPglucose--hexose-1-phosphate uridylyltransferase
MDPNPYAVVVAAGKGTRLGELTAHRPKALVPVGGVPILTWILWHLQAHGCCRAALSINLEHPGTEEGVRQATPEGFELDVPPGPPENGTVREACRVGSHAHTLLVYYGDTITDLPVSALIAAHADNRSRGALATVVYYRPDDLADADAAGRSSYGVMTVSDDNRIVAFKEKPHINEVGPGSVANAAIFIIERRLLETYSGAVDFSRDIFEPAANGAQSPVFGFDLGASRLIDCGTLDRYYAANVASLKGEPPFPARTAAIRSGDDGTVIISPRRAQRSKAAGCVLCPGSEHLTPPELSSFQKDGTWAFRVVPNLYPALEPGFHEVVVDTPVHDRGLESMSVDEVMLLLHAWQLRYRALRRNPAVRHITIFKNLGVDAGASLPHPHSQIIATPIVPPEVQRQFARAASRRPGWMLQDFLESAGETEPRLIAESKHCVVGVPHAPRVPYETWIIPRVSRACFADVIPGELEGLAAALIDTIRRLTTVYPALQYNLVVQTAPVEGEHDRSFCWHMRVFPRHTKLAGYELATGLWINTVRPEDAAKQLRRAAA